MIDTDNNELFRDLVCLDPETGEFDFPQGTTIVVNGRFKGRLEVCTGNAFLAPGTSGDTERVLRNQVAILADRAEKYRQDLLALTGPVAPPRPSLLRRLFG